VSASKLWREIMAKDKEGHGSEAQDKAEHHGRWNMEAGKIDADEATKRLGHRYEEQASKYPTMRDVAI
jgi:hypothetical protein